MSLPLPHSDNPPKYLPLLPLLNPTVERGPGGISNRWSACLHDFGLRHFSLTENWTPVGRRPGQEKRLFLEEKHEGKKEHLDGKSSMCEACMQGISNKVRVMVFAMYCNG